jgi:hypothetical protein
MNHFFKSNKSSATGLTVCLVIVCFCCLSLTTTNNGLNWNSTAAKVVKCYPNPAVSFVNFDFEGSVVNKDYVISIHSFSGKKMYSTAASTKRITVQLNESYFRGIYIFQLKDNYGKIIETGKFQVIK